ncbi:MAG: Holliday junction resolvase RuvX [Planctomycetota bacterium]
MRYLAIDLGEKRTGLAVGDDGSGIVTPLEVIVTGSEAERMRRLERAVAAQEPDALVLGVPLNMDGSVGPAAARSAKLAEELTRRTGRPVFKMDERLTSAAADAQMARSGLTHGQKKARRDALAAAAILRDFLATRGGAGPEPPAASSGRS